MTDKEKELIDQKNDIEKELNNPKNDVLNEKSEKLSNTPKSYSKKRKRTKLAQAQHALKYGIAALSIVSFFTTSRGLEEIVSSKYTITPYLISFGIQVLVLVVGTKLADILKNIRTLQKRKFIQVFVAFCALVPYITSVGFSSFFSYTFLANQAYERVRETDYNIKIESFLNEEFANLDNLNDAAGKVILAQVQSNIPQISNILQQFQTVASDEIADIKNTLIKNHNSDITDQITLHANEYSNASDEEKARLRSAEAALQTAARIYAECYATYSAAYDMLFNAENPDSLKASVSATQSNIQNNIQSIQAQQEIINTLQDSRTTYNMQIKSNVASISSSFESLISSYNALSYAYELIDTNETVNSGTIDLQNIYNTIYSTTDVSDDDVEQAIKDLQSIITSYLNQANTDNLDNESLQNLSNCITYLGEFQKYKYLSGQLDAFEADVLSKVYVIEYPSTTSKATSDADSTNTESTAPESTTVSAIEAETSTESGIDSTTLSVKPQVTRVSQESWNETRREDLGKFINMVKSLPNFETIINYYSESSAESQHYIRLLEKNTSYRTDTLEDAYRLNRQNLEEISSIEKAWNYLHSDFKYMAFYCLCVAVFLDLSSLFVGVFVFFTDGKEKANPEPPTQAKNTSH